MRWLVVTGGVALGVVAYRVQVHDLHSPGGRAAAQVAVGWAFLVAGLVAWARRPGNRLGPLMVATAFLLLARQLRYSTDPALFTIFFALGALGYAMVGHSVLAYPFGRVRGRFERGLVIAGYTTVVVLPLAVLLLYDGRSLLLQYTAPRESVINVTGSERAVELLEKAQVFLLFGLLATMFIAVILRSLVSATPRMRRVLMPLLFAAIVIALRAVFECVFTFVDRPFASDYLFWWQVAAVIALPIALLAGLLRARLARVAVGNLLLELEHTPTSGLRDAFARALDDETLELALALPGGGGFVDGEGRPFELPDENDPDRAVTRIEDEGELLAVLVHDPSLLEERRLVEAVGAAARLALDNARLQAELRVQLNLVEESRARIVAAGDEERRRIERDLHDGAQQRLVAIALELRSAQRRHGKSLDPGVEELLSSTVDGLQVAVAELRELARGIHPTILAEGGLNAALDSLASRSPVPVTVEATSERFPPDVEADAYFVACEALANVTKHSGASSATVAARQENGTLVIEVADDGVGGAEVVSGSGLRGLADRVEARGGRLRIESPNGGGTRIVGEIPCAS
jgi:signal transduction histidine kinase